jgi:hypothetical protein
MKGFKFSGWKSRSGKIYNPGDKYDEKNDAGELVNSVLTATWEQIINTVTFINDGDNYASVKVENSNSINGDGLTDQSMPTNPTKENCIFKEWNFQNDGKGNVFTGDTVVDEDVTVYAIYKESPKLEVKDKTITKGTNLDLKSLIISATDAEDGDLKDKVEITDDGGFNKDKVGKYKVTFKVTDNDGLSATETATVTVKEKTTPPTPDTNNPPAPQHNNNPSNTGDDMNSRLYYALMGISAVLFVVLEIKKKMGKQ